MDHLERFFQPDSWHEGSFTSQQGKNIRYGHATPKGDVKGTVVMTTGYADFIEAYYETIHAYLDRGYAVWMMDWAGHGGSDKAVAGQKKTPAQKAALLDDHIADLGQFRTSVVQADDTKPVFLSTHSMGGQVALRYLAQNDQDFAGAILGTPFVDMRVKGLKRGFLQAVFQAAVKLGFGDKTLENGRKRAIHKITQARRERKHDNPVRMGLHKAFMLLERDLRAENPTIAYLESMYRSAAALNAPGVLENIKTPVLFGLAGKDNMVDNDTIRRAAQVMPQARLCDIPDASHAFWLERDDLRKTWWQAIDGFMRDAHAGFDTRRTVSNDNTVQDAVTAKRKTPHAKGP